MYGEGIIERLPSHSALHNLTNPMRKVFIGTVGALLDDFDVSESREGVYLQSAVGEYLDAHSRVLGVGRKLDESDEHFRNRLIYETLAYLTVEYLVNVFDLVLYYYIEDFDASDNTLTSDNPFIDENGFMAFVDEDIKKILENKFVLGSDIKWLTQ